MREDAGAPSLFVRQASGLVKEFGALDTLIFNVLGFALGLVLAVTPTFLGSGFPNANIYLVLTIGTVMALFNGLTYGLFAAAMPRSGGDYVYIGRTLSPALGFIANWGFSWSQFLGLGVYAAWTVQTALSPALVTFGYSANNKTIIEWGAKTAEPFMIWLIGTILLLTVLVVSVAGMKTLKRILNTLFVVALAGTMAMLVVFLTTSHAQFVDTFNAFMSSNVGMADAYNSIIALGQANGLDTQAQGSFWDSVLALPVGYWVFIGFTYSVYVGGEIKEPQKNQSIAIIGSLLFGYVLYMIIMGQYYSVVGKDFNNAVAIVQALPDSPFPAGGGMGFFAGILTKSPILNFLMGLSSFLWFYLLLFVMTAICVRNIFAWSFDQVLPQALTRITSGNGAPWVSTLVVVILAELFLTVQAFLGIAFINYIAIFSVCFFITGIAAIVFPYRKKHMFEASPNIVRKKIAGVPLIVIAGVGNVILFAVVLYSSLTNPALSGVQGWSPTIILLGIYGLGFLVYCVARFIRQKEGIDLDLLYEEIPPE